MRALALASGSGRRGTVTLTGTGKELLAHAEVVERHLGVGSAGRLSRRV